VARLGGEVTGTFADGRAWCVRDARPHDARPLTAMLDDIAAEPQPALLMLPGQFAAHVWKQRIQASLADPRCLQLTATVQGELAGNLGLRPDAHPSSAHVQWVGMSVGRGFRSLGLGGALLETAAEWATVNGYVKLALGVFPENTRARAFYERHGFITEGVRRAQFARAGQYHDEVVMARFLTGTP
jgi:L-phenylalanine/L-methionine N-acetyltransferase